ncbi:MAG: D-2-hydroxyacid dehydrogenase [Bacteroidales bacterium]|nr:D-2-hydroxyacid dehydrogenase [Bacteroidales bacterium]
MKIVVLDGYTLNPGDLSWDELKRLGDCDCTIYDRTPPEDTYTRSKHAEIILTNKTLLTKDILIRLPDLKYIRVLATGYNVVDLKAATENKIIVTNIPAYSTDSVAQMVFAHILNLTQRVAAHASSVNEGKWSKSIDFCYWDFPQIELTGKTLGLIGFGKIARTTANIAQAFGMKILVYTRSVPAKKPENILFTDIKTIFQQSDIVSLHCPLTPETENLVNYDKLKLMKKSAFLINTGRGPLVNETALAEMLNSGKIAGAGLDVLSAEPPSKNNPLIGAANCFITPHIAWATYSARSRLLHIALENIKAFLKGNPVHVVN